MSAGVANNIPGLTREGSLGAGLLWESERVFAGEYAGISVIAFSTTDVTLEYLFSGNNVDWDVLVSIPLLGGVGFTENFTIKGKFVRAQVDNGGLPDIADLRVFSYGSYGALDVNLSNVTNLPPLEVELAKTGDGSLAVATFKPLIQYSLNRSINYGVISGNAGATPLWYSPYTDLKGYSSTVVVGLEDMYFGVNSAGAYPGVSTLTQFDPQPAQKGVVFGRQIAHHPGQATKSRFSGLFVQSFHGLNPGTTRMYLGMGAYRNFGEDVRSFYGFGYGLNTGIVPPGPEDFGIIIFDNVGPLTKRVVVQGSWNVDKADGTGNLPIMNTWHLLNQFQVEYHWFGISNYYVMSPLDGEYYLVHRDVVRLNSQQEFTNEAPSFGLLMFMFPFPGVGGDATSVPDVLGITGFALGYEGEYQPQHELLSVDYYDASLIDYSLKTVLCSFRVPLRYGGSNFSARDDIQLVSFTLAGVSGVGAPFIGKVSIYRNVNLGGVLVWAPPPNTQTMFPLEWDINGTWTTPSVIPGGAGQATGGYSDTFLIEAFHSLVGVGFYNTNQDLTSKNIVFNYGDIISFVVEDFDVLQTISLSVAFRIV